MPCPAVGIGDSAMIKTDKNVHLCETCSGGGRQCDLKGPGKALDEKISSQQLFIMHKSTP